MPPRPVDKIQSLPLLPIGETSVPGVTRIIGLANNENTERPSPAVIEACGRAARGSNLYPDVAMTWLREGIAEAYGGLDPARVLCAIGSSELIAMLAQCYCGPGDETLIARQGYLYFAIATKAAGATPVHAGAEGDVGLPRTDNRRVGFDPDAILAAVTPRTRIVFLDNPSNPLGTFVDRETLTAFRAALREDILLVLDGAYADFVTDPSFEPGEALVDAGENTVTLRTFSKIYGLAGLRVGWGYFPQAVTETILRLQRPGNIASPCLAGAETAIREQDLVAQRRARTARTRQAFSDRLIALPGVHVLPSHTSFVFATFDTDAALNASDLFARLKDQGILTRPMTPYGQPNSLRITIGTDEEMDIAAAAMEGLLG